MSGYEYLCVEMYTEDVEIRTNALNIYADLGWELVSAGDRWAYFRRIPVSSLTDIMEYMKEMVGGVKEKTK